MNNVARPPDPRVIYRIAVRALCEFTARTGDLDLRFTPSPSGGEGTAGHAVVVSRRGAGYQAELPLSCEHRGLLVRGRADGYDPDANLLEEIKTYRGEIDRVPEHHRSLHWAQAKVYGWLLCRERDLPEVELAIVYFDVATQQETVFRQRYCATELRAFFELQCERFLDWAGHERSHRQARNQAIERLQFPHARFRTGQRRLAESVYRASRDGYCLLAQAPAGIGKTVGTLFPQLKAFPKRELDRLFFLTARTTGRRPALDALAALRAQETAMPVRVLEHVARGKACVHPDKACHGESCPLAQGFYDRLPAARKHALDRSCLNHEAVREAALAHRVCPYYLSQELCRWADVVVCDYNYYFDGGGLLYALTLANEWRVTLLVDEAHNLVDRARGMYSAQLEQARFEAVQRTAPIGLKSPLARLARQWQKLNGELAAAEYRTLPCAPGPFVTALQQAVGGLGEHFVEQPAGNDSELLRFYFDALQFCRLAENLGAHSLFDLGRDGASNGKTRSTLCIRNVVPGPLLRPRFAAAYSCTLFSATLAPARYYADLLGLPEGTPWIDIESPFDAAQLRVRAVSNLSTRYAHREESLAPINALMARQFDSRPGNYLAFFSSYAYLRSVFETFGEAHPRIPVWEQSPGMDETQRQAFLDRFREAGRGIGFAVLGGSFGEAIDLPGDRLVGAFIATLGLPQTNPVNEQIRRRVQELFDGNAGYDYTYLYPGLQKVVQAAGRVIRSENDKGIVYLIDDRFGRPAVRRLLPRWWRVEPCRLPL